MRSMTWETSFPLDEHTDISSLEDPVVSLYFVSHPQLGRTLCSRAALEYLRKKGKDSSVEVAFEAEYDFGKLYSTSFILSLDGYKVCHKVETDCPKDSFFIDCPSHEGYIYQSSRDFTGLEPDSWRTPFEQN